MNEKLPSPHQLMLQERETLNVSGVEDVESFDETMVVMSTSRGQPDRARRRAAYGKTQPGDW